LALIKTFRPRFFHFVSGDKWTLGVVQIFLILGGCFVVAGTLSTVRLFNFSWSGVNMFSLQLLVDHRSCYLNNTILSWTFATSFCFTFFSSEYSKLH
jgi:hypothetical protein